MFCILNGEYEVEVLGPKGYKDEEWGCFDENVKVKQLRRYGYACFIYCLPRDNVEWKIE